MVWSPAARAAAAAARKRNRPAAAKATPLTQRTNTQRNRLMGLGDTASAKGRRKVRAAKRSTATMPHKAIPNTSVSHSLAAPMASPGVAKPTGPQAFTQKAMRPGGANPTARKAKTYPRRTGTAANNKGMAITHYGKSTTSAVKGTKKKAGRKPKGGSAYGNPGYGNPYYHG